MLAKEFVDRLERLGLLDQEIIKVLRQQLADSGSRITPEAVAKLLVDNGQLTPFQASKLIGELRSGQYDDGASGHDEEDLVLVDEAEVLEAIPVEEAKPALEFEPVAEVQSVDEGSADPGVTPGRPLPTRRKPDPQKSVWDSFKVYGYLGIIALLLLVGGSIAWILTRENADELIGHANKLYDQQNYEAAQQAYLDFVEDHPDSQHASLANVRIVMTDLYKAAAFKQEPWRAVELLQERLPAVAEEPGMNEDRANLAELMVGIAENLTRSAERAEQTEAKQSLLNTFAEHRELMNQPLYMTATMRKNLAAKIHAVDEARNRVQRDIDRNVQLDQSEARMKSLLEESQTKAAYDVRKALLQNFPELKNHARLVTLIRQASDIQQTLVEPAANLPEIVSAAGPSTTLSTIVLTTLVGRPATELRGETLYLRAGGSILAFDGESGKLKWRKFVGYAEDLPPVRLEGEQGVLLSDSATLEVIRCGSDDGQVQWRAKIGEVFAEPVVHADDLFVSARSGRLLAMDASSGEVKWGVQIPQPLDTPPGFDERAGRVYIPGDHSNLYVLNARDGACVESFYIGHAEGTIVVPPIPLLGHLFVVENAGTDYANLHVLRVDEQGGGLRVAQPPFRLVGNVHVTPVIQGRRLIVLTDRGQGMVYDVEPTAENEQVTEAATLSASYDQPTATQLAVSKTQMWVTGTRIGRYELQINTGNIVRDWIKHEADAFIGKPLAQDNTLVHARILRGSSAIRVTAAEAKSGEEIWHTDVGVPIAMLKRAPDGNGIHAVTTAAALFEIGREELTSGSTKGPIENPGDQILAKSFENPVAIDEQRAALLNQVEGKSMIVYDPGRERQRLRPVTLGLSAGRPVGEALAAAGGVLVPLDNGRVELFDYRTGASRATPFQPASDPTETVSWTDPVPLPGDPDQVILANSQQQLYRLRVAEQIRELASKGLEFKLLGPAAGVGETWVASLSGPAADQLVGFQMTSLEETFRTALSGRVVYGPVASGESCLVQTDDGQLHGYDEAGKELFTVALPAGRPVGKPIRADNLLVLAGSTGWIATIDTAAGKLAGQLDLQQPISATPLVIGNRLLVPGAEGVIYIVNVPTDS